MDDFPRYKLITLVQEYEQQLYQNKSRCRSFLNDFCGEYRREVFVLSTAVEGKVPGQLLKYKGSNSSSLQVVIAQLKERLKANYAFREYASLWAVESWALALDIISPDDDNCLLLETVEQTPENEMLQDSLFLATLLNEVGLIDDLAKLGVDLDHTDQKERTPLINAVICGNKKIVDKLLNLGAVLEIKDETGYTALHWAIMLGAVEIVKLLLAAGADSRIISKTGLNGLELALYYKQNKIAKLIKNY
ncbi:MAG: ankyrin repeat domain-containing protein [Bacillota bacterium]